MAELLLYRGIPIAVASNSPRHFVGAALMSAGLADLFEVVVSSDDVEQAKPAPDLYLTACALLGAEAERSVAFGSWAATCTTPTPCKPATRA
jgi:HAD superfamily hydrolase (TIGR01509 family)